VEKGTPWFHTIQIKWNSEKDGSYASGSSITFTFHDISEVWDFAGKMAEANTQIVDCVMQEHKEFAESRNQADCWGEVMGYYVRTEGSEFFIKKEDFASCYRAMCKH